MAAYCTTALDVLYRPIRVAYPGRSENRSAVFVRYAKTHWKKIGMAVLSGMFAGFLAGAVSSRTNAPLDRVVYAAHPPSLLAAAVPVRAASPDNTKELSRLRAQNQELQVLVDTLRLHPAATHVRRAKAHRHRRGRAS